jgi:hypothetical protein
VLHFLDSRFAVSGASYLGVDQVPIRGCFFWVPWTLLLRTTVRDETLLYSVLPFVALEMVLDGRVRCSINCSICLFVGSISRVGFSNYEILRCYYAFNMLFVEIFPLIEMRLHGPVNASFLVSNPCSVRCSQVNVFQGGAVCQGGGGQSVLIVETEVLIV